MKKVKLLTKNESKGITLIALVITIKKEMENKNFI